MQADDKCIPQQKQRGVSTPDRSQCRSMPDGWPFRKANRDAIDAQKAVKINFDPFAEEYDMKHKRRGVALILNHVHFESMATRKGSVKDGLDLKASLDKLGFDVRIYTDPVVKTITTVLQSRALNEIEKRRKMGQLCDSSRFSNNATAIIIRRHTTIIRVS